MPAVLPAPVSITTDAAAPPFTLTNASRVVAPAGVAAEQVAEVLRAATGLALPVTADPARAGDVVLAASDASSPEAYALSVTADGARIAASGGAGLFYGAHTLAQLLAADGAAWRAEACEIEDAPRFAYRGVMLDVARHFFSVDTVLRLVDRIAALKLNTLHLHLTDDQGWRIQLDSCPALTEKASATAVGGDAGGFYTKADYARIIAHAASRHVTIVPEVDGPGHTHCVGLAYPELAEDPVLTDTVRDIVAQFGGGLPAPGVPYDGFAVGFSSLRIRDERTYEFLADVFGELASMTPGPYLHIGGDEALGTDPDDFAEYVSRATRIVADLGKTPVAWHEAGSAAGISDQTVGQYWGFVTPERGMDEQARAFVKAGSKVILSPADAIYLDIKYDAESPLGLTWANGPTSVERSYRWEPTDVIDGIAEDDILGVEAALWTETIRTEADLDAQVFPRVASAAEIAWSPEPDACPQRTWASFRERLAARGPEWERAGVGFTRAAGVDWTDTAR